MVIMPVLEPVSLNTVFVPIDKRFDGFKFPIPTLLIVSKEVKFPTLAETFPRVVNVFDPVSVKKVLAPIHNKLLGLTFPMPTFPLDNKPIGPVKLIAFVETLPEASDKT